MNDRYLKELAEKYGTPLYVFDANNIQCTYYEMKKSIGDIEIFYSVKANPSLAICQILQKSGSCIEVASKGELELAIAAGFEPHKIIFSGPGKIREEIEFALEKEIVALIAESFEEIQLINEIAEEKNCTVNIGIRINPSYESVQKNPVISMMGRGTQFGIDCTELESIIPYIKRHTHLKLMCFHIYSGSQIFDYNVAIVYFKEAIKLLHDIIKKYSLQIELLDFGGGFGISYDGKREDFDFNNFALEVKKVLEGYSEFIKGKRIAFESGRFLVAPSGYFLTEVQYRKVINGNTFLITDAGMNQNALATFREKRIRSNFKMHIITNTNPQEEVSVAGPLCTPDDVLGRNILLNHSGRGDILCIPNSGAYGTSFSPLEFLGHPRPCEIVVWKNKEYVIKKKGKFSDILTHQSGL